MLYCGRFNALNIQRADLMQGSKVLYVGVSYHIYVSAFLHF